jgi:hypothetical protein
MHRELTYNKWIKYIHDYQLNKNKQMKREEQVLEWMHLFVDYIQEQDPKLYNKACEYADSKEEKTSPLLYSELNKIK